MKTISFDYSNSNIREHELMFISEQVRVAHKQIHDRNSSRNNFLGWVDYPINYDEIELKKIQEVSKKIQDDSQALVVIGIGGSYLGVRSAVEALGHTYHNILSKSKRRYPEIYFAGNNLSSTYHTHLLEAIDGKDISLIVISKSGETTEPAIAFRQLREYIENKYGKDEAKRRIYITTDESKGPLKELADCQGYETFIIPKDIGGRFSVLTAVGLLPMSVVGIDVDKVISGAVDAREEYSIEDLTDNSCYKYAALRNILYRRGKDIEILASYEPSLQYTLEWWKQLFGESEGKDGKGIFPASVNYSADLHSLGQYIQDARKNIFETVLNVIKPKIELKIKENEENLDGLNFIAGKNMDYVNKKACEGTILAHVNGGVPNLIINIPELSEYYYGKLAYFFQKACAVSGYLLGVNPFDQPGVEQYKNNMFALLNKPGFEDMKKMLERRLYN